MPWVGVLARLVVGGVWVAAGLLKLPDPTESNPPAFLEGEGEDAKPIEAVTDPDKHVLAHVFKITQDPSNSQKP